MVTAPHHACNRRSAVDTESSIFRNDLNNVAALQSARIQKKLMEEAARLQQQKLDETTRDKTRIEEDKKKLEDERDSLRTENESLTKAITEKTDSLTESEKEVGRLKSAQAALAKTVEDKTSSLTESGKEIDKKNSELDDLRREKLREVEAMRKQKQDEIDGLNQTISTLKKQLPGDKQLNCLPLNYHNSTVLIIQLDSGMALDCDGGSGDEDGYKGQTFPLSMDDKAHIFTLTKRYNQLDQDQPWIITRKNNSRKLYFPNGQADVDLHLDDPHKVTDKYSWWYIGRGSSDRVGSWVIRSAEWDTCLDLGSGESHDKRRRVVSNRFDNRKCQNWVIIPIAFN